MEIHLEVMLTLLSASPTHVSIFLPYKISRILLKISESFSSSSQPAVDVTILNDILLVENHYLATQLVFLSPV